MKLQLTNLSEITYYFWAPAKSGAEIGLSFYLKAHRRQLIDAGFFMRTICLHLFPVNALMRSRLNYGGLVEGTKVRRILESGKTNLDQSTTYKIGLFGGGLKNYLKGTVIMATQFKVFTFAIINRKRFYSNSKKVRTVSTLARSEEHARANLKGLPLLFIKRTPANQEVAA